MPLACIVLNLLGVSLIAQLLQYTLGVANIALGWIRILLCLVGRLRVRFIFSYSRQFCCRCVSEWPLLPPVVVAPPQ